MNESGILVISDSAVADVIEHFKDESVNIVVTGGWHISKIGEADVVTQLHRIFVRYYWSRDFSQLTNDKTDTDEFKVRVAAHDTLNKYLRTNYSSVIMRTAKFYSELELYHAFILVEINYLKNQVQIGLTELIAQAINEVLFSDAQAEEAN